jgi:hypothetical protein
MLFDHCIKKGFVPVKDIFIAVGVLSFIALFIYAIVKEARKQKKQHSFFFKKLAERKGWKYIREDNDTIQRFAHDFEGIGVFSSPSLGKMIPLNVVLGRTKVGGCCLFEHSTRIYEGYAMKWFVCLVEAPNALRGSYVVQSKGKAGTITDNFYMGQKISIEDDWAKGFTLYCNDQAPEKEMLPKGTLQKLFREMANLPWRVDIQVRKGRLAVYPSSRNFQLNTVKDLEQLIEFSQVAVNYLTTNSAK